MAHAIADQFTTVTSSGWSSTTKLMQATSVGGSNSVATQASYAAASTGNTTVRMVPEGTATTTAIPAAPAAWSGTGWASPVLDGANVHAVTVDTTSLTITFLSGQSGWTTAPTVAWTVIAYLGEPNGGPITEIGRVSSAAVAAGTVTLTLTPTATSSGTSSSPRLCFEIYGVVGIGVGGIGTNLITVATAGTTARLSTGGAYTSQWTRSGATTAVGTSVAARVISAKRTGATTVLGTSTLVRLITPTAKATTVLGTPTNRKGVTIGAKATTVLGTSTNVRAVTLAAKAVTAIGTAAAARRITAARTAATTVLGTTGFSRAIISARTFAVTATSAQNLRLDIPQAALNRIIPAAAADWPLTAPTTAIAGVTRNAAGAILGGCTVYLVRQTDGVRITSATSNATTGAYSFTRGAGDPYNYRIVATLAGAPEVHGVTDLLVPA